MLKRSDLDSLISGLSWRVFLLHNVHEQEPLVFNTRWAMSYLRGPLTRPQVKILMEGYRAEATVQSEPTKLPPIAAEAISKADMVSKTEADDRSDGPPVIPPGIEPVYLPVHLSRSQAANSLGTDRIELNYEPVVAGFGRVRFYNTTRRIDHVKDIRFILPSDALEGFLRRNNGMEFGFELDDLRRDPEADAHFPRSLPNGMDNQKGKETEKAFGEYLYWETRP